VRAGLPRSPCSRSACGATAADGSRRRTRTCQVRRRNPEEWLRLAHTSRRTPPATPLRPRQQVTRMPVAGQPAHVAHQHRRRRVDHLVAPAQHRAGRPSNGTRHASPNFRRCSPSASANATSNSPPGVTGAPPRSRPTFRTAAHSADSGPCPDHRPPSNPEVRHSSANCPRTPPFSLEQNKWWFGPCGHRLNISAGFPRSISSESRVPVSEKQFANCFRNFKS
jgi:hypothetical protein